MQSSLSFKLVKKIFYRGKPSRLHRVLDSSLNPQVQLTFSKSSNKHLYWVYSETRWGTIWEKLLGVNKRADWNSYSSVVGDLLRKRVERLLRGTGGNVFAHLWHQKCVKSCGCEPASGRWRLQILAVRLWARNRDPCVLASAGPWTPHSVFCQVTLCGLSRRSVEAFTRFSCPANTELICQRIECIKGISLVKMPRRSTMCLSTQRLFSVIPSLSAHWQNSTTQPNQSITRSRFFYSRIGLLVRLTPLFFCISSVTNEMKAISACFCYRQIQPHLIFLKHTYVYPEVKRGPAEMNLDRAAERSLET